MARKTPVTACERKANIVADPSVENQFVPFGTLRNMTHRRPPDSEVRSSTQSTALMPPSLTCSSGLTFSACPGRGGEAWKRLGTGGAGNLMELFLRRREAAGVEVLAQAVQRLARVAVAGEALELRVHGVARADLHEAVALARVEVVERPHR